MSPPDFIFLYSWMFGIYYVWGTKRYASRLTNIQFAILTTISFILIEGFRYDRGTDHLWYGEIYTNPRLNESPSFVLFNEFLQYCGLNYTGACIIYALIFIVGVYYLIKNVNGNEQRFVHLFCICACLLSFECLIRQYIALPLIYMSISFFLKKRWLACILFLFFGFQIHVASILLFIAFVAVFLLRGYLINYKISLSILFFVYFISSLDYTSYILSMIDSLAPGIVPQGFEHYVLNSDRWFGEDSVIEGSEQSILAKFMQLGFEGSMIYLGYVILKDKPNNTINVFYMLMIVVAILTRAFWGMELIIRITKMLYQLWFIPLAYIFYNKTYLIKKAREYNIYFFIIVLYLVSYWLRHIFLSDNCKFIWS